MTMTADGVTVGFGWVRTLAEGVGRARPWRRSSRAILFDREGTLLTRSLTGDTQRLVPMLGAADAIARAHAAGVAVGVVASQRGERGLTAEETAQVNARLHELVGPVDVVLECTHESGEDCPCRVPAPGLIYLAAAALGTRPERCVVVGDSGVDLEAARAAGARSVLVPSSRTTREEIEAAPVVASSLEEAVEIALRKAA